MLIEELRRHRTRQAEELLQLGIRVDDDTHVVAQADGRPLQPNSLTHAFTTFLARSRLSSVYAFTICDTPCDAPAGGGRPSEGRQRAAWPSKVGITLDLYSHVLPGMQAEAAASVDDAMQRALQKRARDEMVAKR